MTIRSPFMPQRGANQSVSPGASSDSVTIDASAKSVRFVNVGANICHVRIGKSPQTATTADTPVAAGTEIIIAKGDGEDTVAHISATGTTLHIQPGEGGI